MKESPILVLQPNRNTNANAKRRTMVRTLRAELRKKTHLPRYVSWQLQNV